LPVNRPESDLSAFLPLRRWLSALAQTASEWPLAIFAETSEPAMLIAIPVLLPAEVSDAEMASGRNRRFACFALRAGHRECSA
jgi:hypothetical protein